MCFDFEERVLIFKFGIEDRLELIEELKKSMILMEPTISTNSKDREMYKRLLSLTVKLNQTSDDEYDELAIELEVGSKDPDGELPNSLIDEYIIGTDYEFFEQDEREAEEAASHMSHYARKHMNYLKNNRRKDYLLMLLDRSLIQHLKDIDDIANTRFDAMMEQMIAKDPPPDKETHPMEWVGYMNMTKAMIDEFILNDLIYSYA